MSEAKAEKAEPKVEKKGGKSGLVGVLVGGVISAVLAAGAAYGGARAANHQPPTVIEVVAPKPPGVTIPLEPFLANVPDEDGKPRAVKLTIAVELRHEAKEDEFKAFVPRVRDATLSYVRGLTFEQIQGDQGLDGIRKDLLERYHGLGALGAERVLVTDLITQ
jgi:flagellar basal body-associated protein FliL